MRPLASPPSSPADPGRTASARYEDDERAYAEWVHRFTGRLLALLPGVPPHRLLGLVVLWAQRSREEDSPEGAAHSAAAWWLSGGADKIAGGHR